jgi:putative transposase
VELVRVERREPGGILSAMGSVGAAAGGHGSARRSSTSSGGETVLRISAGAAGVARSRARGECQAGAAPDARRQSAVSARRFVPATTDSRHGWRVWPNLARGLVTRKLNELWVADITYVRLQEEFVYVAVVLDAHSRRVIGWALAKHLGASVAVEALRMALAERRPAPGLIHHSDRGIQYACADYLTLLADHAVQPSMSRVGNPYDNAKAESFMKTLKEEQVRGQQWRDLNALRADLAKFFQITYNHQRLHSALDYQTPADFERRLLA